MSETLPIRQAVRALIIDDDHRVLLVRFEFRDVGTVWAMPGGGIEDGEEAIEALHRELIEEVGLHRPNVGPLIWDMNRHIPQMAPNGWSGQRDVIFLTRSQPFEPNPTLSWEQLNSEGVHEMRWWTAAEIVAATEVLFAPRRLPRLLDELITSGPPTETLVFFENH